MMTVALAGVLLCGCRADVDVGLVVGRDGSGSVRVDAGFDPEAVARLADPQRVLRVDDLRKAGWSIEAPRHRNGWTWVGVEKGFATPEAAQQVFAEVSGPSGPLSHLHLSSARSFFRTRTTLRGSPDLRRGLEAFSDDDLRQRLGGTAFGADPRELERQLGAPLSQAVTIGLTARLPGTVETDAPQRRGGELRWVLHPGVVTPVGATARWWNLGPVSLSALAALALLGAMGVLVRRLYRRVRRRDTVAVTASP